MKATTLVLHTEATQEPRCRVLAVSTRQLYKQP
jgi:hypothetical protein